MYILALLNMYFRLRLTCQIAIGFYCYTSMNHYKFEKIITGKLSLQKKIVLSDAKKALK